MTKDELDLLWEKQDNLIYYLQTKTNGERDLTNEEYSELLKEVLENDKILLENGIDFLAHKWSREALYHNLYS